MDNFKVYNPIANLIAAEGASAGGGLPITGGTLTGNLIIQAPSKISQCQLPTGPCDVANKQYVDSLISGGGGPFLPLAGGTVTGTILSTAIFPPTVANALVTKDYVDQKAGDASTTAKGVIQLAGDLTGTAILPVISNDAITTVKILNSAVTNPKIAPGAVSTLKGTGSIAPPTVTDINLGTGLAMTGTVLNVDSNQLQFLKLSGGALSGPVTTSELITPVTPANSLVTKQYVDEQDRIIHGFYVASSAGGINLPSAGTAFAFSNGSTQVPSTSWPPPGLLTDGTTITLSPAGILGITNNDTIPHVYRVMYISGSLDDTTNQNEAMANIQMFNVAGFSPISLEHISKCLSATNNPQFSNTAILNAVITVAVGATYEIQVQYTNLGSAVLTIDFDAANRSQIIVQSLNN